MIFVRGIMGDIKLNPAIKLWGGLALLVIGVSWALWVKFDNYREDVTECQARGGVWIGGVPFRVGTLPVIEGRCEAHAREEQ